ncbi:MAG: sigma-70 family RNA polymerase sigma factor [Clostridium sp.]|jgi:RNA polymerase sigma factor (sigma-70 family)|tara:strand:- start:98 stop:862 length:765 start_codon:yes stop_codon:yes gene_type:complete
MKKYNIQNYVRYKDDLKRSMPEEMPYKEYTRDELIIRFIPLVENLARKFSTSDQASGVLSINDLIQCGCEGLVKAADRLDWDVLNDSSDIEKTLKSFFSKRIKGAIRRRIDLARGDIRIPEHKLNEIRKNPQDKKLVALFFNSMFLSIDSIASNEDDDNEGTWASNVKDQSEDYNIHLLNAYLLSILKKYLTTKQSEVLRMSYGLDCDKHSAKQIAAKLGITGVRDYVTVSEIKKEAVDKLIESVDHSQVIDFL